MFGHKKEKKTDRPAVAPGGDKLGVMFTSLLQE